MSSKRTFYRRKQSAHQARQIDYINNLPEISSDSNLFDRDYESSSDEDMSSFVLSTSDSNQTSSEIENELPDPPQQQYIETLFEALFSHVGLNLSTSEKVISLINCLNRRYSTNPVYLPNLRYYWEKKAKSTCVHVYVLCNNNHSHGPFIGEPRNFGQYMCENEHFQASIKPGKYFLHCPLKQQLLKILSTLPDSCWLTDCERQDVSNASQARKIKVNNQTNPNVKKLTLTIHSDEVAIGKSSSEKILPVFLTINEMKPEFRKKFFLLIGLYVGKSKPPVECFLGPIVEDLLDLSINPVEISRQFSATFHLIGLVADAPMRAYLRHVKQYNHLNGCDWCLVEASTANGARHYSNQTMTQLNHLKRKHEDFQQLKDLIENQPENLQEQLNSFPRFKGLSGISPLLSLRDFDIVNGTALEPMHCISLGVFRNMLSRGIFGSNSGKFFERRIDLNFVKKELSERLCSISVPSEFTRIPRDFYQLNFWKSNEYDSFLSYFVFATARGLFNNSTINHLTCLVKIYYLSHIGGPQPLTQQEIRNLVEEFQAGVESIYGESFMSYNLHIMSHLADSLTNLGPSSNISSYPLEDYMRILKEKVHRYSNLGPSLIRFFMSDFRYKEFKSTRLERWNLTNGERIAFGCEKKDKVSKLVEKIQSIQTLDTIVDLIRTYSGHQDIDRHDLTFYKTYKKDGKRYSTENYCNRKKRDDSKILFKDGNHYVIQYIAAINSHQFFLICKKYKDKKVNIKFRGLTGEFNFQLEHIHEVQVLEQRLVCLLEEDIKSKMIFVRSTNFHHKYPKDFLIEQFLWNK